LGYREVRGVAPSRDAIASAAPSVRDRIVPDIMHSGLFEDGSFDTACMFQVFDHLPEPGALLDEVHSALSPDGVVLCFNHNVESVSARILGERSPIIDIEHCYLYSPATMGLLMRKHGFDVLESGAATNTLSVRHFLHLIPAPGPLKRGVMTAADRARIGPVPLRLRLGNLYAIGRRN
jgi:SAM-dependent methyltransferase